MRWEQSVQYAALSDIGFRRRNNQDCSAVQICPDFEVWRQRGHLFVVADGMGGHAVGELASKIAADTVPHSFYKSPERDVSRALREAIELANDTINKRGSMNRDFNRMGTTCSTLVLSPLGAVIGHVGDSRVYRVRGSRIDQLTFDHSLQWELLRRGTMKPEDIMLHEPRHVITRSLGPEPKVQVDIEGPYPVLPGDVYVLCSDGLTGHLTDEEIGMTARELPPADASRMLVNLANLRGGADNISVIVVRIGELPAGLPPIDYVDTYEPEQKLNRWTLAAAWLTAITFVIGLTLGMLEKYVEGTIVSFMAFVGWFLLLQRWWSTFQLRRRRGRVADAGAETVAWRPYRTYSAKLKKEFVSELAAIEAALQNTAVEENWSIDKARHETAFKAAQAAFTAGKLPRAFAEYARAIDSMMAGVQLQRRHNAQIQRWGKDLTPPPE